MKKVIVIFSLFVGLVYAENGRPVMVGEVGDNSPNHGYICGGLAEIIGINKHGDGFVAIRSGPGSKYKIKKKVVRNGTEIIACDYVGKWIGILYKNDLSSSGDCDTSSKSIQKRYPYKGPCQIGWVYKKYVNYTAN